MESLEEEMRQLESERAELRENRECVTQWNVKIAEIANM